MLSILKLFGKIGSSKSFGVGAIVVILAVLLFFANKDRQKLKNTIASFYPDTVYVQADSIEATIIDTFEVIKTVHIPGKPVVTTKIVSDTVYVEKKILDTVMIYRDKECKGFVHFSDGSNKFVDVNGIVDYPLGKNIRLIYTEKIWQEYKKFFVSGGLGGFYIDDKFRLGVGLGINYKRVGISYYMGKKLYCTTIGYRLF